MTFKLVLTQKQSILFVLLSIVVAVVVCASILRHGRVPGAPNGSDDNRSAFWIYVNSTYHFSFSLPKYLYLDLSQEATSDCKSHPIETEPLKVVESGNTLTIGAHFRSCPSEIDPSSLFGWKIYASNGIATLNDANRFVQTILGPGCQITDWERTEPSNVDSEQTKPTISPSDPPSPKKPDDLDKIAQVCPYSLSGPTVYYSRSLHTMLFWSGGNEPNFPARSGWYDNDILESFHFISPH
jgi:hypothetical protein